MFDAIRAGAQSTPMKIMLIVLVLAFISWGIGDYFVSGASRAPIKVNGAEISLQQVDQLQRQTRDQFERQLGQPLTPEMAAQLQLPGRVMVELLRHAILQSTAQQLGFTVPDARLHATLMATPAFQTSNTFDVQRYRNTLQTAGYSPAQFERDLRQDLQGQDVTDLFNRTAPYPASHGLQRLVQQAQATMDVELLTIPANTLPEVSQPDETAQQAFYQQNQIRFQTAPSWDIALVEVLADTDVNTQTELEDRLAGGETLTAAATALGLSTTTLSKSSPETLADLLTPTAQQQIGQLQVGQTSGLLSWQNNRSGYVSLQAFNQPQPREFAEVQALIIDTMLQQARVTQLQELGADLLTIAQQATPLSQIAGEHNGRVQRYSQINPDQSDVAQLIGAANAGRLRYTPETHMLNRPVITAEALHLVRVVDIQAPTLSTEEIANSQQAFSAVLQDEAYQLTLQALAREANIRYNVPALRVVFGDSFNANQLPQL